MVVHEHKFSANCGLPSILTVKWHILVTLLPFKQQLAKVGIGGVLVNHLGNLPWSNPDKPFLAIVFRNLFGYQHQSFPARGKSNPIVGTK